jgi:hypothetical protein
LFPFLLNAPRAPDRTPRGRIEDRPARRSWRETDAGFHLARAKQCGTHRIAAARARPRPVVRADQLA